MSAYPSEPPAAYSPTGSSRGELGAEKTFGEKTTVVPSSPDHEIVVEEGGQRALHRSLKGRHMQMIAIGTAFSHTAQ